MRHKIKTKKLNRTSSHRKAMFANMATALIMNEQIQTTLPKAKALRPYVEKLITKAKSPVMNMNAQGKEVSSNNLSSRRRIISIIKDHIATEKLFSVLGKRYQDRPGGYIRIIKSGFRYGDRAPLAYIELVDRDIAAKGSLTPKVTTRDNHENLDTHLQEN